MPRNKSERFSTDELHMLAYRAALRNLVKVNIDAGADAEFTEGTLVGHEPTRQAWLKYVAAEERWNGLKWVRHPRDKDGGMSWPGILRNVETFVKETLGDAA